MPRLKSAIKRVQTSERNRKRNTTLKSTIKTLMKKVTECVQNKDAEGAKKLQNEAFSLIDRASRKPTLHKKNAARKKSKISNWVKTLESKS